jgi:DUF971 family protein
MTMDLMSDPLPRYELSDDLAWLFVRRSASSVVALPADTIRASCKCAHCLRARYDGRFSDTFEGIAITSINDLGYGLNIAFSDGHDRGIYPLSYLCDLDATFEPVDQTAIPSD